MTGHPTPEVQWSKFFGQLPQGRVLRNNRVMRLSDVRKADSGDYVCTATNLLGSAVKKTLLVVVSLPRFSIKPPIRTVAILGYSLKLNCSATGDPQPVITWKRQRSPLPAGRNQQINGALVVRNVQMEDAGNYICVATSAGVFVIETVSFVEVRPRGKRRNVTSSIPFFKERKFPNVYVIHQNTTTKYIIKVIIIIRKHISASYTRSFFLEVKSTMPYGIMVRYS